MKVLTGMTCSGKTFFMRHGILPNLNVNKYIIYDSDLNFTDLENEDAKIVNNYNDFKKFIDCDYPKIVYQPSNEIMANYELRLLDFNKICHEINSKKYKTNFIIDEIGYLNNRRKNYINSIELILMSSRRKNINIYAISQRPKYFTKGFLNLTDEYYIFNLLEKDRRYIEQYLPFKLSFDNIKHDLMCLHYNVRTIKFRKY